MHILLPAPTRGLPGALPEQGLVHRPELHPRLPPPALCRDPQYDGLYEVPTLAEYLAVAKVGTGDTGAARDKQCPPPCLLRRKGGGAFGCLSAAALLKTRPGIDPTGCSSAGLALQGAPRVVGIYPGASGSQMGVHG